MLVKQSKASETGKLVDGSEKLTLHIDICAPYPVRSLGANRYLLKRRQLRIDISMCRPQIEEIKPFRPVVVKWHG